MECSAIVFVVFVVVVVVVVVVVLLDGEQELPLPYLVLPSFAIGPAPLAHLLTTTVCCVT